MPTSFCPSGLLGSLPTIAHLQFAQADPPKYLDFFTNHTNYFSIEDYLFVYAGFNDKKLNPFQETYSMVWESQLEYLNPLLAEKTIIHGHRLITIEHCEKQIIKTKQVINIDTDCVYKEKVGYGKLTAIELYYKKLFTV